MPKKSFGRTLLKGLKFVGKAAKPLAAPLVKKALGVISGKGDYTVTRNTLTNPRSYGSSAQIGLMHGDMGTTRVKHREYVRDVPSSTTFQNITFAIQPTNSQLFPWLSALAQNYEQYKILGLIFEYRSLSANALNSVNTALGSVSMATQYNSLDSPFVNKQQVLNYQFGTSCKPSESMIHPLECDPAQTPNQPLYVRIGSAAAGDARLYDYGILNYVTIGMQQANVTIGELWVSYDILLIKPRISSGLGLGIRSAFYTCQADLNQPDTTYYVDNGAPLGQVALARFDSIGLTFQYVPNAVTGLDCIVTFPIGSEGLFLLQNTWFGTGAATAGAQVIGRVVYTNCSITAGLYNVPPSGGSSSAVNVGLNNGVSGCVQFSADNVLSIPDPNLQASIRFYAYDMATSPWHLPTNDIDSVMNLVLTQLNAQIVPQAGSLTPGNFHYEPLPYEEKEDRVLQVHEDDDGSLVSTSEIPEGLQSYPGFQLKKSPPGPHPSVQGHRRV